MKTQSINFLNGNLVSRSTKDTKGSKSRTTSSGKLVNEITYKSISGKLHNIELMKTLYGEYVCLLVGKFRLYLPLEDSNTYYLILSLRDIKQYKKIIISSYSIPSTIRPFHYLNIKVNEKVIIPNWNDFPKLEKYIKNGKVKFCSKKQVKYIKNVIKNKQHEN